MDIANFDFDDNEPLKLADSMSDEKSKVSPFTIGTMRHSGKHGKSDSFSFVGSFNAIDQVCEIHVGSHLKCKLCYFVTWKKHPRDSAPISVLKPLRKSMNALNKNGCNGDNNENLVGQEESTDDWFASIHDAIAAYEHQRQFLFFCITIISSFVVAILDWVTKLSSNTCEWVDGTFVEKYSNI
ncbi:hypothetical protein RFI_17933 [Reticulomyxa filosa]|uniref:Uncharacterized protein n=1 Tax=Reticulomyxa filosa TaxID=46433 RepID=X6N077_RETFI|nr:hypothetical protein RFI_17933 [Reticulomyxa filosa]|eukprot:ETO19298.1 hypothetical protein RFI_17933 [Reticulomyxa filosa]